MKLYNTLSRKIKEIKPINPGHINLYTCGPTVYNYAHIGNLRTYIFEDLLKRSLEYNGLKVNHAMNITDVGHLVGDGDEGEDKLEVGAKREGKSPFEIAKYYTNKFFQDTDELNIIRPDKILTATESIPEQIEIIRILLDKGFAYKGEQAIYFNTSKFLDYGKLSGQKLSEKKTGAREEVVVDKDKKNHADFALWFLLTGRYKNHILHWQSPWGEGFPGWHIECSAISRELLGQPFDIHCGGVDHIGTHHTNEIAQSEAAFGVPLANIWMHGEFLLVNSSRMGKSEGNFITLDVLKETGFSPLDFRYMCLQAHYRTQLNFTREALKASKISLERLRDEIGWLEKEIKHSGATRTIISKEEFDYKKVFKNLINYDLDIPRTLALARDLLEDRNFGNQDKLDILYSFDQVWGLNLDKFFDRFVDPESDAKLFTLYNLRQQAKEQKNFTKSDELRKQIEELGYEVMDTPEGQKIKRKIRL